MPENRIKEHLIVKKEDIRPNPNNWRLHPPEQIDGLSAVLDQVGFVDELLVIPDPENKGKYMLVDGEARWTIFNDTDDIPITVLDLSEEEAKVVLTTFDPISSFAGNDPTKLEQLMKEMDTNKLDKALSEEMKALYQDIDEQFATGFTELPAVETMAFNIPNTREALPPNENMKAMKDGVPLSPMSIQVRVTADEYEDIMSKMKQMAVIWQTDTFVKAIMEAYDTVAPNDSSQE